MGDRPSQPLKTRGTTYPPHQPRDMHGNSVQCLRPEDGKHWILDGSGPSSVQSNLIEGTVIRVVAVDNAATIEFGDDPTADATNMILPANTPEYFRVSYNERVAIYGSIVHLTIMR